MYVCVYALRLQPFPQVPISAYSVKPDMGKSLLQLLSGRVHLACFWPSSPDGPVTHGRDSQLNRRNLRRFSFLLLISRDRQAVTTCCPVHVCSRKQYVNITQRPSFCNICMCSHSRLSTGCIHGKGLHVARTVLPYYIQFYGSLADIQVGPFHFYVGFQPRK